jgi:hypothetical protein
MEPAVAAFARSSNDGLIVTIGTLTDAHRELISALAARHRLPAVYPFPFFVRRGGLISYGPDIVDSFRRAAGYVDRFSSCPAAPNSENSKANRIETMKGPAESGQICSGGRRKIAKKIAKNKRCYANTLRPRSRMLLKVMKGG